MIFHEFEEGVADMDIKSGHLMGADIFGLKLVSWYGPNAEKGLPQLVGTVMVFDGSTGAPKAILSAEHVTCMRTGAAGAVGAKYLARKDSKNVDDGRYRKPSGIPNCCNAHGDAFYRKSFTIQSN